MSAIKNYSTLVDEIFGAGVISFDLTKEPRNHLLDALNSEQYQVFKLNFCSRLSRLWSIYQGTINEVELITQVKEISSENNWKGAYAELAAFDYFNQDIIQGRNFLSKPVRLNVTLDKTKTFAGELGAKAANLDGFIEEYGLYFDVKSFKDNVSEILQGIYAELSTHLGVTGLHIFAEHASDVAYHDFQAKRLQILEELKSNVSVANRTKHVVSNTILSASP